MSVIDLYFLKKKPQQDRLSLYCEYEKTKISVILSFIFFIHENIGYGKIAEVYVEGQKCEG